MRATIARHVLERIYGFAEPTATQAGSMTYECIYCGGHGDDGSPSHAIDCPYWLALPTLESAAAARLVEQASHGG
jgi:hypothetical protein